MRTIVTINQDSDTPARREITPAATLTYLYDRSRDSKKSSAPGQDFIAFCYDERRIAFAVCDGVSQSFYGDLAARFLGEKLVAWFYDLVITPELLNQKRVGPEIFIHTHLIETVDEALRSWVDEANQLVQAKTINAALPQMIRDALDRKRENGSEAMFVAGLVDIERRQITACWMGDMRLAMWANQGFQIPIPNDAWQTRERWSSRVGPKNGKPHVIFGPLDIIHRMTIHSDGVGKRAEELQTITLDKLDQLARELGDTPTSDDISILEIALEYVKAEPLTTPKPTVPDAREPALRWDTVGGAGWYRVSLSTSERQWTADTINTSFIVPSGLSGAVGCRVQALAGDRAPSAWSESVTVGVPAVIAERVPPTPAETEPVVTGSRPFRARVMIVAALLLALAITIGWVLLNYLR